MHAMKIMKFGGTSVGSVDSIQKVKKIVEAEQEPVIVVVSALGGITDQLIRTASMATRGDIAYESEFNSMVHRHEDMIQQVIPWRRRYMPCSMNSRISTRASTS